MQLSTIITALEKIAPLSQAQSWDNVGLLAGDPAQEISSIMLTIDYSRAVADEARAAGCDLIVAYHPPLFHAIKRLTAGNAVFDVIRRGAAIYSPHTALDVADGGTNDLLCDVLGLSDRKPLKNSEVEPTHYKLVVFVPANAVESVSRALFEAGAGRIGNYTSCSFRMSGTGTFFGELGAKPTVGRAGQLEQVDEIRLETIVPIGAVDVVVNALRRSHPYEEPAFDLNMLATAGAGQGRIGSLPPTDRSALFDRIKQGLEIQHLLIAGPTLGTITRAAVGAGSCGPMLDDAIKQGAELFLTGEVRHHDAVRAADAGLTVVCTLHSNSERAVLKQFKKCLEQTPGIPPIHISSRDKDPFSIR